MSKAERQSEVEVLTEKLKGSATVYVTDFSGLTVERMTDFRRRLRAVEPRVLEQAWYYDRTVSAFMGGPGRRAFDALAWFDAHVIDGAVNGVARLSVWAGRRLGRIQDGFVRRYALGILLGVVAILLFVLLWAGR